MTRSFSPSPPRAVRSRMPIGNWRCTTSPMPWRCCVRPTTTPHGSDGFVSIEVAPELARDTAATIAAAARLHERIARPNLLVKIPATAEGIPAIAAMIGRGLSINVTLIFSLSRYEQVIEAYLHGLETLAGRGGDLAAVRSVASFFVSRVDTQVDNRLEQIGGADALALRGRAGIAQARLAYQMFRDRFAGPRWEKLAARGAHPQPPLWASTSTKNPDYPDTLYVDSLIGPDTINTMAESTITAFEDHGTVARTIDTEDRGGDPRHAEPTRGGGRHGRCRAHPRRPRRRRLPPVVRRSADHIARQSPPAGAAMIAPAATPRRTGAEDRRSRGPVDRHALRRGREKQAPQQDSAGSHVNTMRPTQREGDARECTADICHRGRRAGRRQGRRGAAHQRFRRQGHPHRR